MSNQITAEDIELVDSVRLALLNCTKREEIDAVFSKFKIPDYATMTEFLQMTMSIEKVYGIPDGTVPSDEEVYDYYARFYLDGFWKEFA